MAFLLGLPLLTLVLVCVALFVIHFLPTFVARNRHVQNFWWIFLINLFFGWTLIGWIIALVWALQDDPKYAVLYMPPPNSRY
ncbi:MAG: superinfection immunity protein [Acidobacteriaceae bacterium]